MTVPNSGLSPRAGLALAAATAGLVLAVSVSAATLLGWLGPAKDTAAAVEFSSPPAVFGVAAVPAAEPGLPSAAVDVAPTRPPERAFKEAEREHRNRAEIRRYADDD